MKTLLVLLAVAAFALAVPTFDPGNKQWITRGPNYFRRDKKSALSEVIPDHAVVTGVALTSDDEILDTSRTFHKHIALPQKKIIIKQPAYGYHHYRNTEDNMEKEVQEILKQAQDISDNMHNAESINTEKKTTSWALPETHKEVEKNINIAKAAVDNIETSFGLLEKNSNVKMDSWKNSDSDKNLHENIQTAKEALGHVQKSFSDFETFKDDDMLQSSTNEAAVNSKLHGEARMAGWKNKIENIQNEENFKPSLNKDETHSLSTRNENTENTSSGKLLHQINGDDLKQNIREKETSQKTSDKSSLDNMETEPKELKKSSKVMKQEDNKNQNHVMEKDVLSSINKIETPMSLANDNVQTTEKQANFEEDVLLSLSKPNIEISSNINDHKMKLKSNEMDNLDSVFAPSINNPIIMSIHPNNLHISNEEMAKNSALAMKLADMSVKVENEHKLPKDISLTESFATNIQKSADNTPKHEMTSNILSTSNTDSRLKNETNDNSMFTSIKKVSHPNDVISKEVDLATEKKDIMSPKNDKFSAETPMKMSTWGIAKMANVKSAHNMDDAKQLNSQARNFAIMKPDSRRNRPTHHQARVSYGGSYGSGASSGVTGVFPNANVGGCGVPLLLSCSPSVVSGSLVKPHNVGYSAPAYRGSKDAHMHSKRDASKNVLSSQTKVIPK